jgi:large subunit ribosomal protein L32
MAVPKKRTGHSAQGSRRSNWKATKPTTTKCPNCGETVLAHTVCTACGTYKGQPVKLADKAAAAAVAEPVKKTAAKKTTAKKSETTKAKSTKKAETAEAKVEEAKVEESSEEKTEE